MGIKKIIPEQVLNSRGEPTLKVTMTSDDSHRSYFTVPAGASLGAGEAAKKFDQGDAFDGLGVTACIDIINNVIAPKFIGYPLEHQDDFDSLLLALDGSTNKENLGANTILALSGAYYKLSAKLSNKPLWQYIAEGRKTNPEFPRVYANIIGGGKHAPGLEIQEFLVIPKTNEPSKVVEQVYQVYHTVQTIMTSLYGPAAKLVGDEGAMAPIGASSEVVLEALSNLNQKMAEKFDIALDVAANSFFDGQMYHFENQDLHASDLLAIYEDWNNKFDLYSLEDPFAETDLEGLEMLKTMPKDKKPFLIVADDYTVTNPERIAFFGADKVFDDVIIKPDQVGSITEMFAAIDAATAAGNKVIISHRSGESNDDFIVDLAYGIGAFGIKIGAPVRGERVAKYNRLLEIEQTLNANQAKAVGSSPTEPVKPQTTVVDQKPPIQTKPAQPTPPPTPPKPITPPPFQPHDEIQFGQTRETRASLAGVVQNNTPAGSRPANADSRPTATDIHARTPFENTAAPKPPSTPVQPTSFQSTTQEMNPALRAQSPAAAPPTTTPATPGDMAASVPPLQT